MTFFSCCHNFLNLWKWRWVGLTIAFVAHPTSTQAQSILADETFNTRITQNNLNFIVTNGTQSGQNLFHSFREFSIPSNGTVIFDLTNTPTIATIFSRVTGDQASSINGLIKTLGGDRPSIFFLNPNGILFGPQAKLDIGGSFVATTAQGIQFQNGVIFDSFTPADALLSLRVPIGLQMGPNPAAIQLQGTGHRVVSQGNQAPYKRNPSVSDLRVQPGKTLAFLGGSIDAEGGVLSAENLEVGAVQTGPSSSNAFVGLIPIAQGWTFDYSQIERYGNIQLSKQSLFDISGRSPGAMQLRSQDLILQDGSLLLSLGTNSPKGQINVSTQGLLLMEGRTADRRIGSGIEVYAIDSGEGAAIAVTAKNIVIRDISRISSRGLGQALTGDIQVQSTHSIYLAATIPNNSINVASIIALTYGQGNSGEIRIKTPLLQVFDDAVISAATLGAGNAGNLDLETDRIEASNGGTIGSSSFVQGNAGRLTIKTRSIDLQNGGLISSNSLGQGNGGSIEINATESVLLQGVRLDGGTPSQIRSTVRNASPAIQQALGSPAAATGNGGSIVIRSPKISLNQQAEITVRNEGTGKGGDIALQTAQLQLSNQARLTAETRLAGGGDITITGDLISLRQGSSINVTAGSRGQGGLIRLQTGVLLGLENSDIIANAFLGNGGQIRIQADQIYGLEYRSQITPENDITAISQYGVNGTVSISDLRFEPNTQSLPLPIVFTDERRRITDQCQDTQVNRFIITGRGGLPKTPTWNLDSNRAWRDIRATIAPTPTHLALRPHPPDRPQTIENPQALIEASNWTQNLDGTVSLVAPDAEPIKPIADATCGFQP